MTKAVDAAVRVSPRYSRAVKTSVGSVAIAGVCLFFADVSVTTLDPWSEIQRMAWGVITPDFFAIDTIGTAIIQTLAFALTGTAKAT